MTTVVHIKNRPIENFVMIGRPSKWGNPFVIGVDGNRDEVIRKYRRYLMNNIELLKSISELKGKVLVCYCKPKPCHGDILAELANAL